jgi:anaerobic magnesium-protoporphyrin IX monomethyl ester cyclase
VRPPAAVDNRAVRILFLEVDTERSWAVASIGPGFIGAVLRQHGHEVAFLRAGAEAATDEIVAQVVAAAPELLGLSLTTRQWLRARGLVAAIRARLDVPVVAGGLHPTFSPEEVLATPGFDYVCLGEGEAPMLELVEAMARGAAPASPRGGIGVGKGIANIWVRGGSRPPLREPWSPLDSLPFMARDLLDEQPGVVHMTTQRGCPFPCTYCAARMYNQLYEDVGEYGRRRSHGSVLEELFGLQRAGRLGYVIFLDDTFTINHGWVREFCRVYGSELGVPFSLHARVETVNERMLYELAAAGCAQITYGVESGSERVRREIMKRQVGNDRFRDVFRWTQEAGIAVTANYMMGLPGETPDDLQQTLALAEELAVLDFGYFVFYPYPGTQLFQLCRDRGYLPADYLDRPANHRETILDLPGLGQEEIARCYDGFTALRERLYAGRLGGAALAPPGAVDHVHDLARTG